MIEGYILSAAEQGSNGVACSLSFLLRLCLISDIELRSECE